MNHRRPITYFGVFYLILWLLVFSLIYSDQITSHGGLETFIQILQVLFAALVALVPPFYPHKSLFIRRAQDGVQKIRQRSQPYGDLELGYVERGEIGFKPLSKAIQNNHPVMKEISMIGLAFSDSKDALESFANFEMGACVLENAVLYIEYSDGEREPIVYHPFDPRETIRLIELRNWVKSSANKRAHYLTAALAVGWTSIAILTTVT